MSVYVGCVNIGSTTPQYYTTRNVSQTSEKGISTMLVNRFQGSNSQWWRRDGRQVKPKVKKFDEDRRRQTTANESVVCLFFQLLCVRIQLWLQYNGRVTWQSNTHLRHIDLYVYINYMQHVKDAWLSSAVSILFRFYFINGRRMITIWGSQMTPLNMAAKRFFVGF